MPLYYVSRLSLFVFLSVFRGGDILYDYALGPFFLKYENEIDQSFDKLKGLLSMGLGKISRTVKTTIRNLAREALSQAVNEEAG